MFGDQAPRLLIAAGGESNSSGGGGGGYGNKEAAAAAASGGGTVAKKSPKRGRGQVVTAGVGGGAEIHYPGNYITTGINSSPRRV